MQNQLQQAELALLSKAARFVPRANGRPVHVSTLHRWATRGLAGVKLQVRYEGGDRLTCRQWITEFFDAVTAAKNKANGGTAKPTDDLNPISKRIEAAERMLTQAGI